MKKWGITVEEVLYVVRFALQVKDLISDRIRFMRTRAGEADKPATLILGGGDVGVGFAQAILNGQAAHGEKSGPIVITARTKEKADAIFERILAGYTGKGGAEFLHKTVFPLVLHPSNQLDSVGLAAGMKAAGFAFGTIVLSAGQASPDSEIAVKKGMNYKFTFEMVNERTNVVPKKTPYLVLYEAGCLTGSRVIVVSSIAAGFAAGDPRLKNQLGYAAAQRSLEEFFTEAAGLASHDHKISLFRCPLVRGATADRYQALGIVPKDIDLPTACDAARKFLEE